MRVKTQAKDSCAEGRIPRVLVTGGAGYIGSHTLLRLLDNDVEVCVIDNFSNSSPEVLRRVKRLSHKDFAVFEADLRNFDKLRVVFRDFQPDAVIHFAGLKAVGESVVEPLLYYDNNVVGTTRLLEAMDEASCTRIIFSSSATVYGEAQYLPLDEAHPVAPANPYGRTKAMAEEILKDWVAVDLGRAATLLRYFNPIGAHASGEIGEDPAGVPNNLLPFVARVAVGLLPDVSVFGNDFSTRDGTGERDYIHVEDLAVGHTAALEHIWGQRGCEVFNLGTGQGSTVMEVLDAFEKASSREIPRKIVPRRPGDTDVSVADPSKARRALGWKAEYSLLDACEASWQWQTNNPNGFRG